MHKRLICADVRKNQFCIKLDTRLIEMYANGCKMLHICYIECYTGIERYVRWIP